MKISPLVSIIVPVYNAENTVIATIKSIVSQTYTNWELLIINDGAKDSSDILIKNFIAENSEVKGTIKYITQENAGVSNARNKGLKLATGDFIAFVDSDDVWKKNKIEVQMDEMDNNKNVDLLATTIIGEQFNILFRQKEERLVYIPPKKLLLKNYLVTSTLLFKAEILKKVGYFNEEMRYAEDLEFFVRISKHYNCYLLNEPLVIFGHGKNIFGDSGLSANLWEMEKGELKAIKMGKKLSIINPFEYIFYASFSFLKYIRRVLLTFVRRLK